MWCAWAVIHTFLGACTVRCDAVIDRRACFITRRVECISRIAFTVVKRGSVIDTDLITASICCRTVVDRSAAFAVCIESICWIARAMRCTGSVIKAVLIASSVWWSAIIDRSAVFSVVSWGRVASLTSACEDHRWCQWPGAKCICSACFWALIVWECG